MLANVERLNRLMAEHGIDAIVATLAENVTYLSGYWALSQWIRRGPQTYVVWPAPGKGEPVVIAASSLLDLLVDQKVKVGRVEPFGTFVVRIEPEVQLGADEARQVRLSEIPPHASARSALVSVINGLGPDVKRIAIDEYGLSPTLDAFALDLKHDCDLVPGFEILRTARAVKTDEEIRRLGHVANAAETSIEAALSIAAPGVTEKELAREFHLETIRCGAEPVLCCIGTGARSAMPNVQPSDRQLQPGDIIRFDVGGRYRHYRADIARIAVLGEPSEKVALYHRALLLGVRRGIEMARPGVRASDIFREVVRTVRDEGIPDYDRTHVGHGIGLDGYDRPDLSPSSEDVLEVGMVLCIETPFYEIGFGGLQVEDMVVVREHGSQSLMRTSGDLIIVQQGEEKCVTVDIR